MTRLRRLPMLLCIVVLAVGSAAAQNQKGVVNFLTPINPDPVLQHSKEIYVLNGCAYCHGVDLQTRGEAADLMHSTLVGKDQNGEFIGALLRVGIPQTGKIGCNPESASCFSRYARMSVKKRSPKAMWSIPARTAALHVSFMMHS